MIDNVSEVTGLPVGVVKFAICLFSIVPLGLPFRVLKGNALGKQLYGTAAGMVLCYCGYGLHGFGHMLGLAVVSFVITKIIPRKLAGFAVFGVSFAHLTTCHVLNASGASWNAGNIDFTGSQMVLVLKVSGVAFNYMDGLLAYEDMSTWQKQAHLKALPSLLEFMGYVFDPSSVLVGPTIDFCEYLEFIHDRAAKGLTKQPGFILRALQNFLGNLFCLALHLVGSSRFPVSLIGSPEWYSEFALWYKLFVLYAISLQTRMKYYFVWGLGHTSMIASGQALRSVKDSSEDCWDRGLNVMPLRVEFGVTGMDFTGFWNMYTGNWLRHHVYDRCAAKGKKPGLKSLYATQTISGFWHGLYPGYWMFFVSSTMILQHSRGMVKVLRNLDPAAAIVMKLVSGVVCQLELCYFVPGFLVLEFKETLQVWSSMYFIGHLTSASLIVLFNSGLIAPRKSRKDT